MEFKKKTKENSQRECIRELTKRIQQKNEHKR